MFSAHEIHIKSVKKKIPYLIMCCAVTPKFKSRLKTEVDYTRICKFRDIKWFIKYKLIMLAIKLWQAKKYHTGRKKKLPVRNDVRARKRYIHGPFGSPKNTVNKSKGNSIRVIHTGTRKHYHLFRIPYKKFLLFLCTHGDFKNFFKLPYRICTVMLMLIILKRHILL